MAKELTLVAFLSLLSCAGDAVAQKRSALLMGNAAYDERIGTLRAPTSDVATLEAALKRLGFDVETVLNGDFVDLHRAVSRHATRVREAGANSIGFVYYAGHGASHPSLRRNFLIPVDVKEWDDKSIWERSLDAQADVIDKLRANAPEGFHFVVLDACRNELRIPVRDRAIKVANKAYVKVPDASGVLVAYSTQDGMTAPDGGRYARILARHLEVPGVEAVTMFRNIQLDVRSDTGQEPFMTWSGLQRIYFAPLPKTQSTPQPTQVSYKTCRLPEFGQEGWLRSEVHTGSTGWVGGGRSQPWGCDRVAAAFISARAIGQRNKVERVSSSERSRKDILGHASYNYTCTVRVSWDPLFAERADPKCGVLPANVTPGSSTPVSEFRRFDQPVVNRPEFETDLVLNGGDKVFVNAGGCIQTGGGGRTWKRYVNPVPADKYFGTIEIPGAIARTRLSDFVGKTIELPVALPTTRLRLGYVDDDYQDNGYSKRDDGLGEQCKGIPDAFVEVTVTRK